MNVARGTEDRSAAVRSIAENVLDARAGAGVTRKAMARALGVTTSTLWRKETGGTEFKASELVAIATACGVDVARLMAVEAAAVKRTLSTPGGDQWRFLYAPSTWSCPTTSGG
jgi:transcriptional regulator with XRE-family HTH domain